MYNNTDNTSNYASLRGRNSSSSTYYAFINGFNFDAVPSGASVTSFSVKIRCYRSSNQRTGTNYNLRLASTASNNNVISNTTASTDIDESVNVITIPTGNLTWTQLSGYGSGFSIEVPLASNASSYPYVYVYGAEIEVTYTLSVTEYETTITNNSSVSVSPTGSGNYTVEGGSQEITFTNVSDVATLRVMDNNVDVSSQLINTSGTTYKYTIENISADHTVVLSNATAYNITASSNDTNVATVSPASGRARQGDNFDIFIETDDVNSFKLYDNNVDSTSSVVPSQTVNATLTPLEYSSESTWPSNYVTNPDNALNNTSNETYAQFAYGTGSSGTYAIYNFDCSSIPSNAEIVSVHCEVKAYTTSTSRTVTAQLYNGSTSLNYSGLINSSSSSNIITLSGNISWTREYLDNLKIRFTFSSGNENSYTTYYLRIYGASLIINYTTPTYYRIENVQAAHNIIVEEAPYLNITGSATLSGATYSNLPKKIYVSGSSYTVQLSGITNQYSFRLSDNNTDVTSSVTNYTYTIQNITTDHALVISEATYYALSYTSELSGVGFSDLRNKIYDGETYTAIMSGVSNRNAIKLLDNNVDVTSSIVYSGGSYRYTITNAHEVHTLAIIEQDKYTITTSSTYGSATISSNPASVYPGDSFTVTLNVSNISLVTVTDNGMIINRSFSGNNPYTYTVSNVNENHNILVTEKITYTITCTDDSNNGDISPTGETIVDAGNDADFTVTSSSISSVYLYDNGVDVRNNLVTHNATNASPTFNLASYVSGTLSITGNYPATNGANGSSNTSSYARFYTATTNTLLNAIYSFNVNIPENATIDSVSCVVRGYCYNGGSYYTTRTVQLYSGNTAKGDPYTIPTSNGTFNLTCGTWTPSEFSDCTLKIEALSTSTSTSYNIRFYGATLTVNYHTDAYYTYTISGVSTDHNIILADGPVLSVTCTDNATNGSITPTGTQYVSSGDTTVFTLTSSDFSLIRLKDNDVDVTSQIVHSQGSGSGSPVFVPSSYHAEKPDGATGYVADGINNENSGLTDTSSTSSATLFSLEHGGYEWASFHIAVSGIPEGAIIDSVTCKVKVAYVQSGMSADDNKVQLYYGNNTPKGTATKLTYGTTFNDYLDIGTWTLEELQDVRLYVCGYGKQGGQGFDFIRFYGAELTVTYHSIAGSTYSISNVSASHNLVLEDKTFYTFTCTDNATGGNITPTGTQNVEEGTNAVYTLTSSDFSKLRLTDNGVDVTNQIVYSTTTSSGSPMFVPSGYTNGNPGFTVSNISNGYTDTSSSSQAILEIAPNSTCSGSFIISVSGIPTGSIIESVSCKVKCLKYGNYTTCTVQLYSGNTPKGTAFSITNANQATIDLETGIWTVEDLQDVRLLITETNPSQSSSMSFYFSGAEFTVVYHSTQGYTYNILNVDSAHTLVLEDSNTSFYIKVNGSWVRFSKIWKKVSGVWTEVTDATGLLDSTKIYIKS